MTQLPAWVKLDGQPMLDMLKDGPKTKEQMTRLLPQNVPGPYTCQCKSEAWQWLYQEGYFKQAGTTLDGSMWLYEAKAR